MFSVSVQLFLDATTTPFRLEIPAFANKKVDGQKRHAVKWILTGRLGDEDCALSGGNAGAAQAVQPTGC
jgi:hypothetical protein